MPISEVPFPAIVICGLGSIERRLLDAYLKQVVDFVGQNNLAEEIKEDSDPLDILEKANKVEEFMNFKYPGAKFDVLESILLMTAGIRAGFKYTVKSYR